MAADDSDEEMYDYTPKKCVKASVKEINGAQYPWHGEGYVNLNDEINYKD